MIQVVWYTASMTTYEYESMASGGYVIWRVEASPIPGVGPTRTSIGYVTSAAQVLRFYPEATERSYANRQDDHGDDELRAAHGDGIPLAGLLK